MKQYLMLLALCFVGFQLQADWSLLNVVSKSDLQLTGASRVNGKKVLSAHADGVIKQTKDKHKANIEHKVLVKNSKYGTLRIHLENTKNHELYDLYCSAYLTHAVDLKRSRTQEFALLHHGMGCSVEDGTNCAVVVLKKRSNGAVVAQAVAAYVGEDETPGFDVKIYNKPDASYKLELVKVS